MAVAPAARDAISTRRTIAVATVVLMAMAGAISAAAAVVVDPGLPYDEPAHWANVLYIAENGRLPVLGEAGVQYQAQQSPLFYLLGAGVARVSGESLLAVRLLGALGFVALTGLTALILWAVSRGRPLVTVAGTAFIALNPMLGVMSGSVQNDTWALVWGFAAIAATLRPVRGPRWVQGAVVGVAASLAILTKVSMAPLLIAIVVAYLLRRRYLEAAVSFGVTVIATGWWVVRNLVLYGDLTGQSAVELTGAVFEPAPASPLALAQRVLTYLTLPTEYVRNAIQAPAWVDATAVVVGAVIAIGLVILAVREWRGCSRWGIVVICLVAAFSLVAWLVQSLFGWPVAFRTAYAALPLFALGAGMATRVVRTPAAGVVVLAITTIAQLAAGAWVLVALATLDHAPML